MTVYLKKMQNGDHVSKWDKAANVYDMFNEEKTQYVLPDLSFVILPLYSVKCFIAEDI